KRFGKSSTPVRALGKRAGAQNGNKTTKENTNKGFQKEIKLHADTTTTITHNQRTKRINVTAMTKDGKKYELRYKIKDQNKIEIRNLDTTSIKVSITAKPELSENKWYNAAQHVARFAMMVRNISFTYRNSHSMALPGFIPNVGDFFGQRGGGKLAPGLDFAFGLTGDSYINKAYENGWLISGDSITTPASINSNEDLQIRVTLEPIHNLKIDLNASRTDNRTRSITLRNGTMPQTLNGSFNMTTISIGTALSSTGNADNGYSSKTFRKFLHNLDIIQGRMQNLYEGVNYPTGTSLAGQPFNPENGTISKYSADVMVPAFLAAYTNRNATRSTLDIFPSMLSMLPNWKMTFSGLVKLPWLRDHFKSINLTHAYKSVYAVGSYNSYSNYMSCIGYNIGFVNDVVTGSPVPSSIYDISSVSINESFSPLLGIDMTLNNNMTIKLESRKSRVLNLSVTALQIVETSSDDYVVGLGYKIQNLNLFGAMSNHKIKSKGGNKNAKEATPTRRNAVSHDLNIRVDFSFKNQSALCRNIQNEITQATSGNKAIKISASADYTFSKRLTLNAYFDRQRNVPLLSSSSYPTTTIDFGVSMKFSLTR
ncbi:MAG: cell surface protein SprA, partial [Paludibacteraceae bacterium]|nr:cell surface protein SprA [Paludibacteraceae bacterium]